VKYVTDRWVHIEGQYQVFSDGYSGPGRARALTTEVALAERPRKVSQTAGDWLGLPTLFAVDKHY
jgi:hypothetical protein